ncbi:hypothetical protein QQS45_08475 [Alteriqipengyuania flavescens]|uniref:hypothetical protein n=1 Tax=Alteriqipengyuania flavescens TaxID=3053610 RepID=UPI0025B3FC26|nr:hypothetical protein [Alteriqipengyuania flavescens]WJY17682.1 hypothetical protein QQW98_08470 [Alteriqipengyuania flavescens]WJY23625.1 hypothetical protein QQS45_08475 [Alteriqipengyuania flavescens]
MKPAAALAAALLLSACASLRVLPPGVDGNSEFVTVSNVWNTNDALPYAEKHCAEYGKVARASGQSGYTVTFDCVTAEGP